MVGHANERQLGTSKSDLESVAGVDQMPLKEELTVYEEEDNLDGPFGRLAGLSCSAS